MAKWLKSAVIFCCIFIMKVVFAADFPASPNPFHYVNDYTATLSVGDKQALENKLVAYEVETSSQIAVVIIPTTGEYEVTQYAIALGDKWGIGRKKLDNGVLMLIAKNDRKISIVVGQGLEGVLPDAFLSEVIRKVITPQFAQNQYAQGIANGLDYIIRASKGEFAVGTAEPEQNLEDFIPFILVAIFILFVIFGEIGRRRSETYLSPTNKRILDEVTRQNTIRRRGDSTDFGINIGGNDFRNNRSGGFGGGGFGGGGASGSW